MGPSTHKHKHKQGQEEEQEQKHNSLWTKYAWQGWPAWVRLPQRAAATPQDTQLFPQHIHFPVNPGAPDDNQMGPGTRLRRWSTVQQRRLSADRFTLRGKIMQQRTPRTARKVRDKRKGEKPNILSGANGANIALEASPRKLAGLFGVGDWKERLWRRT